MSHAAVLVVPTEEAVQREGGIEEAVAWEMAPFDEGDTWFRDGSRWDWYVVGGRFDGLLGGRNIVQMKELSIEAIRKQRQEWNKEAYLRYTERENPFSDVEKGETLEAYIARKVGDKNPLHTYAFLRNRHWNEPERMGWFGASTYTECERKDLEKARANPGAWFGKCLHKDEKSGARVICWNEPTEIWIEEFYRRFILPLSATDTLVVVDYHV